MRRGLTVENAFYQYRGTAVNCGRARSPVPQQRRRHFIDVTVKAGVEGNGPYYGFSAIFIDSAGDDKFELSGHRLGARLSLHQCREQRHHPRFASKPCAVESPESMRLG
jgi:hypothetical protein